VIPPGGVGAVGPTGQVANTNMSSFPVGNGGNNTSGRAAEYESGQRALRRLEPPPSIVTIDPVV
jgi:hypothetical protein